MAARSTLQVGQVVNRTYEIVRLLGSGYSGDVWEARHLHLPMSVALKIMHEADRDDAHKGSRFRAEAAVFFRLHHENIVRILDANETPDGLFFLVMELLAGETLTQRLAKGRLHPLRALKYAYDMACGLDAAHEIHVVHRDVKPDNVFITGADVVKLLDFNSAKFFDETVRTTEPGARVGTLAYMSPEHIDGTTSDARIDQYSLGLVLYTMLRGKHPFERYLAQQYKLIQAQSEEMPEPLAKVAGLPSRLDDLLAPALAKKIEDRYATMADFARAIHECLRWVAGEMRAGRLTFKVPLGEPPIDVVPDKQVYFAPKALARQTTAPVPPTERVSVAPEALADDATAGDDRAFDNAKTGQLPASRHAETAPMRQRNTTTATVLPATTGRTGERSQTQLARLALVLAVPAAVWLGWRWRGPQAAAPVAVAAAPSAASAQAPAAELPVLHADVVPVPSASPASPPPEAPKTPAAPAASTALVAAAPRQALPTTTGNPRPAGSVSRAKPEPSVNRAAPEAPAPSAGSAPTATATATATPPPAAPSASAPATHRPMFESEN